MNALSTIKPNNTLESSSLDFVIVQNLIKEYDNAKKAIFDIYASLDNISLDNYQIIAALTYKSYSSGFNSIKQAIQHVSSCYWKKLDEALNLRNFISEKEHDALITKVARDEIQEFNYENVNSFINSIWNSRHYTYARKVDSLFDSLSKDYKSNLGAGVNPFIIIHKNKYASTYSRDRSIDEVRFIARQLFNLDITFEKAETLPNAYGEWQSIDNNLLKVKFYENGNCHVWFNQCLIDRINVVLNLIYPNQVGTSSLLKHKRRAYDEPLN